MDCYQGKLGGVDGKVIKRATMLVHMNVGVGDKLSLSNDDNIALKSD